MQKIDSEESNILSVVRVIAFVFILLCHFTSSIESIGFLGQIFNVGNSIFFLLSGYLFGTKDINHPGLWLKRRMVKILIPYYLWLMVLAILFH